MSIHAIAPTASGIAHGRMNRTRHAFANRTPGRSSTSATEIPSTAWKNTDRTIQMIEKVITAAEVFCAEPEPLLEPVEQVRADVDDLLPAWSKSNGTAGIWPASPPRPSRMTPPWSPSRRFRSRRSVSDMRSS